MMTATQVNHDQQNYNQITTSRIIDKESKMKKKKATTINYMLLELFKNINRCVSDFFKNSIFWKIRHECDIEDNNHGPTKSNQYTRVKLVS